MVPKNFSQSEEGGFKPWVNGNVDSATLARWSPDNDVIFVRGVQVFAFTFQDDTGAIKVWNCKTGWQQKGML